MEPKWMNDKKHIYIRFFANEEMIKKHIYIRFFDQTLKTGLIWPQTIFSSKCYPKERKAGRSHTCVELEDEEDEEEDDGNREFKPRALDGTEKRYTWNQRQRDYNKPWVDTWGHGNAEEGGLWPKLSGTPKVWKGLDFINLCTIPW